MPFGGGEVPLTILHDDGQPTPWYLLRAGGFFEGDGGASGADPYQDRRRDPLLRDRLLRDSLFFAAALPHALAALGIRRDVILHAHDWELASCGLTVKEALLDGVLERALTVLTLHNPYDRGLSVTDLALLTPRCDPLDWPPHPARREARRQTVLQAMVPLFDAPLTTVSRRFAHELTEDPLLVGHFVDHLQEVFGAQTVQGIDNGPFGPLTPPFGDAVTQAEAGDWAPLRAAKQAARAAMLQVLEDLPATHETYGRLLGAEGGAPTSLPGDVPVFFMFGRLDPGQKGFDLLARAIEAQPEGAARYVLAPLTTPEAAPFLQDLRHLARQRLGEVVVFPQRIQRGYAELMAGASFAVLPSFYEPFGAATEPLLAGTPVVARATGGLSDQIRDALDTHGAGYLFRETIPETDDAQRGWREVQARQDPLERTLDPPLRRGDGGLERGLGSRAGAVPRRPGRVPAADRGGVGAGAGVPVGGRGERVRAAVRGRGAVGPLLGLAAGARCWGSLRSQSKSKSKSKSKRDLRTQAPLARRSALDLWNGSKAREKTRERGGCVRKSLLLLLLLLLLLCERSELMDLDRDQGHVVAARRAPAEGVQRPARSSTAHTPPRDARAGGSPGTAAPGRTAPGRGSWPPSHRPCTARSNPPSAGPAPAPRGSSRTTPPGPCPRPCPWSPRLAAPARAAG